MLTRCHWLLTGLLAAGLCSAADGHAADDWDACRILQKADVEAAFAPRKFDAGIPERVTTGSAKIAAVSNCTYSATGATIKNMLSVSLLARRAPTGVAGTTPAEARKGAAQLKATPVDVSGLGEGAYWINIGTASAPTLQLNVFRGKRDWLIYGISGKMDSNTALANLTTIAKATSTR